MWQIQEFFFLLSVSFFEREREEKSKVEICLNPLAFPQREKKILENKIEKDLTKIFPTKVFLTRNFQNTTAQFFPFKSAFSLLALYILIIKMKRRPQWKKPRIQKLKMKKRRW